MKLMKIKKLFIILCIFVSIPFNLSMLHESSEDTYETKHSKMYEVVMNAPLFFNETTHWFNVSILKETPLYDFDGILIAYCFDLQNTDTEENAYIIINADDNAFPIVQYSPKSVSPYFHITETALYMGVGVYYYDDGTNITNILTGKTTVKLYDNNENEHIDNIDNKLSVACDINYSIAWDYYADSSNITRNTPVTVILSGVPNWQWTRGCSPTAVGMQLAKNIPTLTNSLTSSQIINRLADNMGTTSSGSTPWVNHGSGTAQFLVSNGFSRPRFSDWYNKSSNGTPLFGAANNPYSTFVSEINSGRAVSVGSTGSTVKTPGYPNGWNSHVVTGLGYSYVTGFPWQYIIVHTTSANDGQVYLFLNNNIVNYAWFIVRP
ncbi:MAG: hypothetical protein LBC71_05530 [Oscillospiraceae bacterium]|jgi:hypothetical protein|nr:hypothetical protein [Oscillospiraceae bacterium]